MATIDLTQDNFRQTVEKDGIVLVDAWADWCGPCKAFSPIYDTVSETHPTHVFGKIDTEDQQGLAAALQIRSIPTLFIFRDGIGVFRHSGILPEDALEDLIHQVEGLDMDDVRKQVAEQNAQDPDAEDAGTTTV